MLFGIIMNSSLWFQVFRIIKRKSSQDISLTTYAILTPGFAVWLIYGVVKNDLPLILSNVLGLIAGVATLIVTVIYRKKDK
jgi:MtN3 and saliva related transmembrane protein